MSITECVIVMTPNRYFSLRLLYEDGTARYIDIDDAMTPNHARRKAIACGYNPTHWIRQGVPPIVEEF